MHRRVLRLEGPQVSEASLLCSCGMPKCSCVHTQWLACSLRAPVTPCWLVCSSGRRVVEDQYQRRQTREAPAQRNETLEEQLSKLRETNANINSKLRETNANINWELLAKAQAPPQSSKVGCVSVCPPVTVFVPHKRSDFPLTKPPSELPSEDKRSRAHGGQNF
jgi:hypothetical protein